MVWLPIILAVLLAVIHLFAGKLRFLDAIPRSRWLSFASGTSIAYVFGHLLPRLAEGQDILVDALPEWVIHRDMLIWVAALLGLVVFYGLERRARRDIGERDPDRDTGSTSSPAVFRLHIVSYGIYNLLIGYLLMGRIEHDVLALLTFWTAMALHLLVNDYGLRKDHAERYGRVGRWVLSAAVVAGSVLGLLAQVHEAFVVLVTALIGGGVIMNVLKEELPEHRRSRFWAFAAGAACYLAILLLE